MSLPDLLVAQFEDQVTQETGLGLLDKVFYGGAATLYSAVNSLYNTATWYGSWLGINSEPEETADWLRDSIGDDAAEYYQENQAAYDTAGFLLGSIGLGIGTTAAIKAMQLGKWGATAQRYTGVFSSPRAKVLEEAAMDYKQGALSISAQLSSAKNKAMALGVADNAVQSLFTEAVIVGTMHQAPIFEDWEVSDFMSNALVGIGLGAGIGGLVDHLRASKFFKDVQIEKAKATRGVENIGGIGAGDFTKGDRITALIESLDGLPLVQPGEFARAQSLIKDKTVQNALLTAKALANEMAGGNKYLGAAMIDTLQNARLNGAGKQELGDLLSNVRSLKPITESDAVEWDIYYFMDRPKGTYKQGTYLPWDQIASTVPIQGQKLNLPFKIRRGQQLDIAFEGIDVKNVSEGFQRNADIVLDRNGIPHINQASKNITRAPMPGEKTVFSKKIEQIRAATGTLPANIIEEKLQFADVIMDLKTGELTETAYATVGDLAAGAGKEALDQLTVTKSGEMYLGVGKLIAKESAAEIWDGTFISKTIADKEAYYAGNWFNAHARWALAQSTKTAANTTVKAADLPMLVRLLKTVDEIGKVNPNPDAYFDLLKTLKVIDLDGNTVALSKRNALDKLYTLLEQSSKRYADTFMQANVSVHEMQRVLNYPVTALQSMDFSRQTLIKNYIDSPIDVLKPNYVKLRYNVGNVVDSNTGMALRGAVAVEEKIKLQREANVGAFAAFAGPDFADKFINLDPNAVRQQARPTGVSAGFITAAEGDYSLKGQVTYIGKLTSDLTNERKTALAKQMAFNGGNALIDSPEASAEVGLALHAFRRTGRKYVQINYADPVTKQTRYGFMEETVANNMEAILKNPQRDFTKNPFNISELETGFAYKALKLEGFTADAAQEGFRPWIFLKTPEAETFMKTWANITGKFADEINLYRTTQGLPPAMNPNHMYAPPPDLRKYPHIVFIRDKQGGVGKTGMVGIVTGKTEAEFKTNIAKIDQSRFQIITKKDTELWHKAQGDYDYNMLLSDPETDAFLRRNGLMADFYPNLSGHEIITRLEDYTAKQSTVLTKNFVSLRYSQEIEELLALSSQHMELATSTARRGTRAAELAVKDPYLQYVKTMLNMSSVNEHPWWAVSQEKINAFLTPAFNKAKELFFSASNKVIDFDAANDMAEQMGLGRVYEKVAQGIDLHQAFRDSNGAGYDHDIVSRFVSMANNVVINLALRLDHANALINAISWPILAGPEIRSIMKHIDNPEITGQLGEMLSYQAAQGVKVPSATKLMFNSVQRLLDPVQGKQLADYYNSIGITKPNVKEYYNLLDDMSVRGNETMSAIMTKTNSVVDGAAKLFLSDWTEQHIRMLTADVMKQITEIAGIEPRLAAAYINTFNSRVHGVITASQRPTLFQGPLGQAIGLFQSYQFNLIQNVFRHLMNKDKMALAMMGGLQASIFGVQSLPAFHYVNTHLIGNAAGNREHSDAFSFLPSLLPKDLAEPILYGGISWFSDASLYTRGDINPRNITVVPIIPTDWPAVSAFSKIAANAISFGENLAAGAGLGNSLLFALEHNGISRPLTGLIQSAQGYTTTSKGGLIAAHNDLFSWGTAVRLLGSKELNQAIAMDANYRIVSYRAADKELRLELSRAIRTKLLSGTEPDAEDWEDFAFKYAKSGGTQEGYNRFIANILKTYKTPVANRAIEKLNTSYSKRMWEIMGGEELEEMRLDEAATTE